MTATRKQPWGNAYGENEHERALERLLRDIQRAPDPTTGEPTNVQRAHRALWTLRQYARAAGLEPCEGFRAIAAGLLTDVMHLCDSRESMAFGDILDAARIHHSAEAR